MKRILLLLTCIALLSFTGIPAEDIIPVPPTPPIAGVYLYSNGITTNAGNSAEGHPDEVPVANTLNSVLRHITIGGGGGNQIGPPEFADISIKKAFDITSLRLSSLSINPNPVEKDFELRYYNGISTEPVYKIVLTNSYISSAGSTTVDCQGSGCIGIQETFTITFKIIAYHNLMVTPPQILTYNRENHTYTWTNN
jgi:hypothetical protein